MNGPQWIQLEMLASEGVEGNFLDPERDVPFAVLCETQGTLHRLIPSEASPV